MNDVNAMDEGMSPNSPEFLLFLREMRQIGFHGCIENAARQTLPALVFPKVYREFLRQECNAAHLAHTNEGRLLLSWVGWKPEYYLGALSCDDESIDGPLGPQQLIRQHVTALQHVFPERRGEIATRVMKRIIDALGIPSERDELKARRVMLADAEAQLARPVPPAESACDPVVRALADMTAAELGVVIPWSESSLSGLDFDSPNMISGMMRPDGRLIVPSQNCHDMTDRQGLAADMLQFMCWLPCIGVTHVPVSEHVARSVMVYLSERPQLHDRAKAIRSSLHAVQLQWTEKHIERIEAALKGRRLPYQIAGAEMYVSALARVMSGAVSSAPRGGWYSAPLQKNVHDSVKRLSEEKRISPSAAARELLVSQLVQMAMYWPDWENMLRDERVEGHNEVVSAVRQKLNDPSGVEVSFAIAAFVEAEGLPTLGRLKQPQWVPQLCEEALRQYQDAESAFIDRVDWQPTPRVPAAPYGWAAALSGYARAVESELLFTFFDPVLAQAAADRARWSDELLRMIRDGPGRSIGAQFARFVVSRRQAESADTARMPCLGDMHFLLAYRPPGPHDDPGATFMTQLRLDVIGSCWQLGIRRNAAILQDINRYRVDSAHARRANTAREVTRDQALLGRRIMVHYLQFLVELKAESVDTRVV
jgi:hypothetical protein